MTKRTLAAWTMTLALPLSAAASELSLEAAKNESGLRFNEGSVTAQARQEKGAVYAGDAKAVFKDVQQAAKKSPALKAEVSPVAALKAAPRLAKAETPAAEKDSVGRVLLRCAGGLAGLGATVAITAAAPIAMGMAVVAGATAKAYPAAQNGGSFKTVAKEAIIGGLTGAVSLVLIGDAIGDALGKGLEKLFKKN